MSSSDSDSSPPARKRKASPEAGPSNQQSLRRVSPKKVTFQLEQTWTNEEKERMLEAVKRYDSSMIKCISKFVGTKTEEEVSKFISEIHGRYSCKGPTKPVKDSNKDRIAPLEAWLGQVQRLIKGENKDMSENLSQVVRILGRNEVLGNAIHPTLNWKNIYQYVSDLLDDKVSLQTLSQLEAYVLLDVMHNMANSLKDIDIEKQRKVLEMKYNLLNSDPRCFPEVSDKNEPASMAMRNDFTLLENMASSSSSDKQKTSGTTDGAEEQNPSKVVSIDAKTPNMVKGNEYSVVASSGIPTNTEGANLPIKTEQEYRIEEGQNEDHPGTSQSEMAWTPESGYARPRYFTMNPLCIPPHLVNFSTKKS